MTWSAGRIVLYPGFILLLSASAYFGSLRLLAVLLGSGLVHELGHIAAVRLTGRRLARLRLSALGAELTLEGEACTSFLQDLLLSLSGPAANLLLAAVLAAVGYFPLFVGANLLLGCFNLLPVCPLDGGCALFALLSCLISMEWAERVSRLFSRAFSLLVVFCGMLLLLLEHGRPWLLLIGVWLSAASFRSNTP